MPTTFPMANPWVHAENVDETKMNARVTVPVNDLAATVATLTASVIRFRGMAPLTTAIGAAANIAFAATEDPQSGWNATTHLWTVPTGGAGLYIIASQLRCDAVAAVPLAKIYINGVLTYWGTQGPSGASNSSAITVTKALAVGDTVACQTHNAYTTNATGGDNFLTVTRIGNT